MTSAASHALEAMAQKFLDNQVAGEVGQGWGQFIDGDRQHTQIGPYGTSAGVITRALSRVTNPPTSDQAMLELKNDWQKFRSGEAGRLKLFSQNVRLAMLLLAFRHADAQHRSTAHEIQAELESRQLGDGGWGNWWVSQQERDEQSRTFPSSMVAFCMSFTVEEGREPNQIAASWASRQKPIPVSGVGKSRLDAVMHALAVLVNDQKNKDFNKMVRSSHWRNLMREGDFLAVYFYDFKWRKKQRLLHGREYLIAPLNIIAGIAAIHANNRVLSYFAAIELAGSVSQAVLEKGGFFIVGEGQRASSLNQAWAAILISSSGLNRKVPLAKSAALLLLKKRDHPVLSKWAPVVAVILATFLGVFAPEDPGLKGLSAVLLLLLGWLTSGPITKVLRRA